MVTLLWIILLFELNSEGDVRQCKLRVTCLQTVQLLIDGSMLHVWFTVEQLCVNRFLEQQLEGRHVISPSWVN